MVHYRNIPLFVCVFITSISLSETAEAATLVPCNIKDVIVTDCRYGTTKHWYCNITVCKQGPGMACGGRMGMKGECGAGMVCTECNRCEKCSTDHPLDCYVGVGCAVEGLEMLRG